MINNNKLHYRFQQFLEFYKKTKKIEITSFKQVEQERYKRKTWSEANERLKLSDWNTDIIGKGIIIENVINAIEIDERSDIVNNFMDWKPGRTIRERKHQKLIDAIETKANIYQFENAFYNFYVNDKNIPDKKSMEIFINLFGKKYDFIAYLFFIKDDRMYLPIKPKFFKTAFDLLDIKLKLAKQCSWDNYSRFLEINNEIKKFLNNQIQGEIRLVDAHSFLWILATIKEITNIELHNQVVFKEFVPVCPQQTDNKKKSSAKIDFERLDEKKRISGELAENSALKYERKLVKSYGFKDEISKVKLVSEDNRLGYDIISIDKEKRPKFIEVKAVQKGNTKTFYITEKELKTLKEKDNYYIYMVENAG